MKNYSINLRIFAIAFLLITPALSQAIHPAASPAPAPVASTIKIGVIDMQTAITQLDEAKQAIKDMEAEGKKLLEAEQKAQTEIDSKMVKYRAGADKLTEKARQQEEQKLTQEFTETKQSLSAKGEAHNKKGQEISQSITAKVGHISESVAKKMGLDLLLKSEAVLYKNDLVVKNVTSEVVSSYNKAFPVIVPETKKKPADTKAKKSK